MSGEHGHDVSTHEQAERIINRHKAFWVSDCGCRVGRGRKCRHGRMDTCLSFSDPGPKGASGGGATKKVTRAFVDALLQHAAAEHLICQPFNFGRKSGAQGVCFCCDDCCFLFNPKPQPYHKGTLIERTDKATCINCGKCVKVCFFGARRMKGKKLAVNRRRCSGCGLCVDVCPSDAITMVKRT
jgi:Pyruvate/2-oxoacid:ferredoxin oxidoreductase delta subunit